ncbi:MAG: TRAP transporter large permease [Spirochaetales bacterium]|jgi:C4-dicarboxylate transporter DctM subunit|nr:TRAP transporter large permease [Spirochaetales bacterium]
MALPAIVMIILVIVLGALGLPIAWALCCASLAAVLMDPALSLGVCVQKIFTGCDNFAMLAIPAFFLAGDIMSKGGLSRRLVTFADSLIGWISGGISLVAIVGCSFFAAISGSSVATTAAIGGIMYPEMVKRGYPKDYSAAIQAIGGTLGIVIPPSVVFVIYGNITGTSVSRLLMSGVIPGFLTGFALCLYAYFNAKKHGFPKNKGFSFKRFLGSFKNAVWALFMPVIILGGIYAGVFTPTESAVIAVFYGVFVCFVVFREISGKTIREILKTTAANTANLMFLVMSAILFGYLITYYNIPVYVTNAFMTVAQNRYVFMFMILVLLTICGMFLEVSVTNLILGPLLAPIAVSFGVDPIHFGMVFVFMLALGQATPPFGSTMFVACGLSDRPVSGVAKRLIPFVIVELICASVFAYAPVLSTFLPNLL